MKQYLVDTNIIIDILLDREGADAACAVVDGAERGDYDLFLCALSFTNIYYSLRKLLSHEARINALEQLKEVIGVAAVDEIVINKAIHSNWKDFEDAVQNYSAMSKPQISGIITRNTKDFELSTLDVIDPQIFLEA